MNEVAEIREFNRFYTKRIGLLDAHLPTSTLTLAEGRIIWELATAGEQIAAQLCRRLAMDKAYFSRIAGGLRERGLVAGRPNPAHRRQTLLSLTEDGRAAFAAEDQGTRAQMEEILTPLDAAARQRLMEAMKQIRRTLDRPARRRADAVIFRPLKPGDIGWVIHRQGVLYHRQFGWDLTFEALVAEILGGIVSNFDPAREDAWIAELNESIVGSVFLSRGDDPGIGKLRLLYVEPEARGLGIGAQLVSACIERARQLGYRQLTLWTNDVLVSARRIYQAAGFRLVAQEVRPLFGQTLVGQTWLLDLPA